MMFSARSPPVHASGSPAAAEKSISFAIEGEKLSFDLSLPSLVVRSSVLFVLLAVAGCYERIEASYQSEMDPRRVDDVKTIAGLVRRYQSATGFFPLEQRGLRLPIYVELVPGGIPSEWQKANASRPGTSVAFDQFVAVLQSGLGEQITVPIDPQKASTVRPAWYQYQFNGDFAYVAASLASPLPGTRRVADLYFKYEVKIEKSTGGGATPCVRDTDCPTNEFCSCRNVVTEGPDRCMTVAPHAEPGFCFRDERVP